MFQDCVLLKINANLFFNVCTVYKMTPLSVKFYLFLGSISPKPALPTALQNRAHDC